jgi:hypothetical protein
MDSFSMKIKSKIYKANNGLRKEEETGVIGLIVPGCTMPVDGSIEYVIMTTADESEEYNSYHQSKF